MDSHAKKQHILQIIQLSKKKLPSDGGEQIQILSCVLQDFSESSKSQWSNALSWLHKLNVHGTAEHWYPAKLCAVLHALKNPT